MTETSQSIFRVLALTACIALFAGIWSNDHPQQALAMNTGPIPRGVVEQEPEWIPVPESVQHIEVPQNSLPARPKAALEISVGNQNKQFELETGGLLIAAEILEAHINQLPIGIAAGDYRIVDSLGGVGWLHVRTHGKISSSSSRLLPKLLTTTIDNASVQYIRVTEIAGRSPRQQVR